MLRNSWQSERPKVETDFFFYWIRKRHDSVSETSRQQRYQQQQQQHKQQQQQQKEMMQSIRNMRNVNQIIVRLSSTGSKLYFFQVQVKSFTYYIFSLISTEINRYTRLEMRPHSHFNLVIYPEVFFCLLFILKHFY